MTSSPACLIEPSVGARAFEMMRELYPICRSITGDGVRQTLSILARQLPLEVTELPTGMKVFDWTIPQEWNIRDAFILDDLGRRVIDFREHNLHVVGYSEPVHRKMRWSELRPHLHTLPEHPDRIPYLTSYYQRDWGFCLTHQCLEELEQRGNRSYEVCIDSSLTDGSLTMGEVVLPGEQDETVLISAHICHPSLANDNLSGVTLAVELARDLATRKRRYTYRFLFAPGTIGAIAWLATHPHERKQIRHGLVLTLLGDRSPISYKRSRRGDSELDRLATLLLSAKDKPPRVEDFDPLGYDERQFCSPGIDLPVGRLFRAHYGKFPEYHTSADDLQFTSAEALNESFAVARRLVQALEDNVTPRNRFPCGEPQLGRRGLFSSADRPQTRPEREAIAWVLNLSDQQHSLLDMAERSGLPFDTLRQAAARLLASGLLEY